MREKILKLFYEKISDYIKCKKALEKYIEFCLDNNLMERTTSSELHHILPKSKNLFPEYSNLKENSWNGTHLTYSNHYIAHSLLVDAIHHQSVIYAWHRINKLSTPECKELIGAEKYSELRNEHKQIVIEYNKTRTLSKESKQKMSDSNKNKVSAKCLITGEKLKVSKEEFDNNDSLVGHSKDTVIVKDLRDCVIKPVTIEDYYSCDFYIHITKGLVSAIDIRNRERLSVTKEEFNKNEYLVGMGSKEITIFNKEDELILQTPLSKLKKNNIFSIPLSYFVDSAKSNKPINVTAQTKSHETRYRNLGYFNYIGWYAKIEEY